MFTGIIEKCGILKDKRASQGILRLVAAAGAEFADVKIGESISVNGVCLSVAENRGGSLYFDLMEETQRSTTLGLLKRGALLNLERAVSAQGRFGSHLLTGHIDGTGRVIDKTAARGGFRLRIEAKDEIGRYLVDKGSVAVDGVGLTIAGVEKGAFSVSLIPLTLRDTNLGRLLKGDSVNIEADLIGKYAEKFLMKGPGRRNSFDEEFLKRYGYV